MEGLATERGAPEPLSLTAQQAVEQVRDQAMFLVDRHGRIASWNEGVGLILGWTEQDWVGQPLAVAFTPEDVLAGVPVAEMRTAAAHGRADDNRWMVRRSGERFFARGALTRMADENGALVGFVKILRDRTQERRAEEERERLLDAEGSARASAESRGAALAAAFDAIDDGVCLCDARGVQRSNAALARMLGAPGADALRLAPDELVLRFRLRRSIDGPLLDAAELPFVVALAGESAAFDLWASRHDDGAAVWMRCAAAPMRIGGQVAGAVAVFSDLSERLRLHEQRLHLTRVQTALQERNAELRAVTDSVRDYAIYTVSPAGRIASWHEGAALLKGYSAEEAIGMPYERLFTADDRRAGRPALEMDIAARSGEFKGEGVRLRKDGSTFEAAVVLSALRGAQGELLGFLKLTQDITERKRLQRELQTMLHDAQAARGEAERASRSKDEFLAAISHELRTPLAAILGWAHVLEGGVDRETQMHGLLAISRNARTQVQLIEDLIDMNRLEAGRFGLDAQAVELDGVIAAAVDSALPAATAKGVGLRTDFGARTGAVAGDATRLQQVVGNLLGNAIKFTPAGGQVSVALAEAGGAAQITVADNGQGIEPAFLARLFDRFQQQDAGTTRRHGGLGIGLSIVRHLVELHGGTVRAESAGAGAGATFTVTLPLEERALPAGGSGGDDTAAAARLDGVTVLLVDDEADVRAATQRTLQRAGAEVTVAASAAQALPLLREQRPAVLLSDIAMPEADGYELMRRVRALPASQGGDTPAAAFSAYVRPEDRDRATRAGFQMHLAKPVLPAALIDAVARLARRGSPRTHETPSAADGPSGHAPCTC